jgi:hypothetical protein
VVPQPSLVEFSILGDKRNSLKALWYENRLETEGPPLPAERVVS